MGETYSNSLHTTNDIQGTKSDVIEDIEFSSIWHLREPLDHNGGLIMEDTHKIIQNLKMECWSKQSTSHLPFTPSAEIQWIVNLHKSSESFELVISCSWNSHLGGHYMPHCLPDQNLNHDNFLWSVHNISFIFCR